VLGWELELAHLAVGSCGGGLGGPNRSTLLRVCAHDLLPRGRDSSPLSEDSFFLFSTRLGGEFELGEFGTPSFEVSNRTSSWKWLCGELCVFLAVHSNCLLLGDRIKNGGVRRGILSSWSVLCAYRHPVFHRCWPGRRWNEIAVPVLFL
jgi:hypothetical protein